MFLQSIFVFVYLFGLEANGLNSRVVVKFIIVFLDFKLSVQEVYLIHKCVMFYIKDYRFAISRELSTKGHHQIIRHLCVTYWIKLAIEHVIRSPTFTFSRF